MVASILVTTAPSSPMGRVGGCQNRGMQVEGHEVNQTTFDRESDAVPRTASWHASGEESHGTGPSIQGYFKPRTLCRNMRSGDSLSREPAKVCVCVSLAGLVSACLFDFWREPTWIAKQQHQK